MSLAKLKLIAGFAAIAVLSAGCDGGKLLSQTATGTTGTGTTGTGTTATTPSTTPANLLLVAASPVQGAGSSTVAITATVTDASNVAVSNASVVFSAAPVAPATTCSCSLSPGTVVSATDGRATTTLSATVAGRVTVTATIGTLSRTVTVTIPATPNFRLGTLSGAGVFTDGAIAISQSTISASGSTGLQVTIFDTANNVPFSGTATVAFASNCLSAPTATAPSVTSSTGTFNGTYTANGCSGADNITASASSSIAGVTGLTATGTVTVQSQALGSIAFDSVVPATGVIGLKGTGQGETAQIIFLVRGTGGAPFPNATVNFALTTTAGGLRLQNLSATSDGNGRVSTTVEAGTVATAVRVLASTAVAGGTISTQSSLLTVSTGFPTQDGFSLAATLLNLVGDNVDGVLSMVTARLSDRYGNPVPNGTAVSFQTECGQIQPRCTTTDGACTVTFTTSAPRTSAISFNGTPAAATNQCFAGGRTTRDRGCDDHRCSIVATVIGEESFDDCNGRGVYISQTSARNNAAACPAGNFFVSLPEAFLDANENNQILTAGAGSALEGGETPIDFNNNGVYNVATGRFKGLLCSTNAADANFDPNCDASSSLHIRKTLALVLTSTGVAITVRDDASAAAATIANYQLPTNDAIDTILFNATRTVFVAVHDSQGQLPAANTTVTAAMTNGTVLAPTTFTVPNSNAFGFYSTAFVIQAPANGTNGNTGTLTITSTTPATTGSGAVVTIASFCVPYPGGAC